MQFKDKVAVITGAGGGIGEAYAQRLAERGARVVVADIDQKQGERVARSILDAGKTAMFVRTDVADERSTRDMAAEVIEAFGGVDYLVNNAAIYGHMKLASLLEVDMNYYRHFMDVNMNGCLLTTRAVVDSMTQRGGGAIVNQSSTAAWMGVGFYGIAKLAMHGITQSLARELGSRNIRVNALAPGPTDTEATRRQVPSAILEGIVSQMPLRRVGLPGDLVGALEFLLSDSACWITGHVLNVDGGQWMRV